LTDDEAMDLVRTVLREVAPEADLQQVGPDEALQEALDLDSLDFLNFAEGLHDRTGIEIPERVYPQLSTLKGCITFLTSAP
jgi:acyl carrier protein